MLESVFNLMRGKVVFVTALLTLWCASAFLQVRFANNRRQAVHKSEVFGRPPKSPLDEARDDIPNLCAALGIFAAPSIARALDRPVIGLEYRNPKINIQSDDFWYPPFLIGRWNVTMKFQGAKFTNKVPLEVLAQNNNIPGFSKYSVIFAADMGKDIENLTLRWAQVDSHPREDHPFNIRQLLKAFAPDAIVDSAPYNFQKAPDWFHSPANHWTIKYHDTTGEGVVELLTRRRNITVFAGGVETTEFIQQTHTRTEFANSTKSGKASKPKTLTTDYAINWKIAAPGALRDEFVTLDDLRKSKVLEGSLDYLVYFQPTSDLYLKEPGTPAGVYTYDVRFERLGDEATETENTVYPFVWRDAGPVELDQYFGY